MYLREHGYEEYVEKAVCCKSYYVVEEEDEFRYEKGKKILTKTGALSALEEYRKSVTKFSYFPKAK